MRGWQVERLGEAPKLTTIHLKEPGADEITVQIEACGLNFADLLMIDGAYQDTPEPPFTLGMELSGTVTATGAVTPGQKAFSEGDRVVVFAGEGGLAEAGVFSTARATLMPETMRFDTAAALQVAYGTSHLALSHRARLQPDETLVVLGAAGGVGLTAVEIGKIMGANVVAVARGAEKLEVARRAGADHLIDSETGDLREALRELGGADVVYDPVGGDQFTAAMRACKPEARILSIGFASGAVPKVPANHLLVKNVTLIGFYWGGYFRFRPDLLTGSLSEVMAWIAEGKLTPHISHSFSLDRAMDGLALLRARKSTGKVVITLP